MALRPTNREFSRKQGSHSDETYNHGMCGPTSPVGGVRVNVPYPPCERSLDVIALLFYRLRKRGFDDAIIVWRVNFNIGAQRNTTLAGRLSGETLVTGRMSYAIETRR